MKDRTPAMLVGDPRAYATHLLRGFVRQLDELSSSGLAPHTDRALQHQRTRIIHEIQARTDR